MITAFKSLSISIDYRYVQVIKCYELVEMLYTPSLISTVIHRKGKAAVDSSRLTVPFVEHFYFNRRAFQHTHEAKADLFLPLAGNQLDAEDWLSAPGAFGGKAANTAAFGGRAYRETGRGRRKGVTSKSQRNALKSGLFDSTLSRLSSVKLVYFHWLLSFTFTFRAFSRLFYPERLSLSTFVRGRRTNMALSVW